MLSLTYQSGKGCDADLRKYLIDATESLVFNDKNKEALSIATVFDPFFQQIDEKIYLQEMHSNTQFCVNRSGALLKNIAHMVKMFAFKLSKETAV